MDEFFLVQRIQVWTTDLFHSEIKNIHIIKTIHKIFREAGNRAENRPDGTFDRLRIAINLLELPYEANSKHLGPPKLWPLWDLENSPNHSLPSYSSEKEAVFWSLGLIHLSRDANSTVSRLACSRRLDSGEQVKSYAASTKRNTRGDLKWGTATILPMNLCGSWRTPPGGSTSVCRFRAPSGLACRLFRSRKCFPRSDPKILYRFLTVRFAQCLSFRIRHSFELIAT